MRKFFFRKKSTIKGNGFRSSCKYVEVNVEACKKGRVISTAKSAGRRASIRSSFSRNSPPPQLSLRWKCRRRRESPSRRSANSVRISGVNRSVSEKRSSPGLPHLRVRPDFPAGLPIRNRELSRIGRRFVDGLSSQFHCRSPVRKCGQQLKSLRRRKLNM